jgi:hypothetical protein
MTPNSALIAANPVVSAALRARSLRSRRRVVTVKQGALYAADEEREERR